MKPLPPGACHCCICINGRGRPHAATWVTDDGYLLCDDHKDSDVAAFIASRRSRRV